MPQLLHLRQGEELPFFVRPRDQNLGLCSRTARAWRSLHRLQRTVILIVLAIFTISFYYVQVGALSNELEASYKEGSGNVNPSEHDKVELFQLSFDKPVENFRQERMMNLRRKRAPLGEEA